MSTKRMCGQDRGIINAIVTRYEDEVTRYNVINKIDGKYHLEKVAVILRKEVRRTYLVEMKAALKLPKIDDKNAFFNTITVVVDEKKIDDTVKRILGLFPQSLRKLPAKKADVPVWKPKKIKTEIVEEECIKPPQQNHQALDALVAATMHDFAAHERGSHLRRQTQEITTVQETKSVNTLLHEAEELAERRRKDVLRLQRKLIMAEAHLREYEFRSSQWKRLHQQM